MKGNRKFNDKIALFDQIVNSETHICQTNGYKKTTTLLHRNHMQELDEQLHFYLDKVRYVTFVCKENFIVTNPETYSERHVLLSYSFHRFGKLYFVPAAVKKLSSTLL